MTAQEYLKLIDYVNEKINFERNEDWLEINLQNEPESDLPICFKIAIG